MAEYAVVNKTQLDADMTSVADTIRSKGGTSEKLLWPDGYNAAIEAIQTGGGILAEEVMCGTIEQAVYPEVKFLRSNALSYCENLTHIEFPSCTEVGGESVFRECVSLVTAKLPLLATAYQKNYMFDGCSSLKQVDLSSLTNSGSYTFRNCTSLEEIALPSLSENEVIYGNVFENCTSLKRVDLRGGNFSRTNTFKNCKALETLILRKKSGIVTLSNVNNFDGSGIALGTGYVYVYSVFLDAYKTATNWSTLANQFRAIEDYPEICGEAA